MAARPSRAKAPMPRLIRPQLAFLATRPPVGGEWLHEIKYDGYRLLARLQNGAARLYTRSGNDWTARFPSIAGSLEKIPVDEAWIDGEIVSLNEDGTSSLEGLQNSLSSGTDEGLVYMVFDLLYLDGADLCNAPLHARKNTLERLLEKAPEGGRLRYSSHMEGHGEEFFEAACARGLEGIVSKLRSSPYAPGRARTWQKVKCRRRQEFVIGGYMGPKGGGEGFGALALGVYEKGFLRYCGRVGTGFGGKTFDILWPRLKRLTQKDTAFRPLPGRQEARSVRWVRPRLVAEVEFTEWTKNGVLRHPSFKGLRLDKAPRSVVREYPPDLEKTTEKKQEERAGKVRLTNPEKALYPEAGLTKKDLAEYYEMAAPYMLPHLSGRPLTLLRCPEGCGKGCFFQKNPDAATRRQVRRIKVEEEGQTVERMIVDTPEGITALVQMGALEIHTWGSRAGDIDSPDRMVFDLDPAPEVERRSVIDAAFLLRELL
ncbi:MAG: DNA ligase D, partial [Deltaproteobacteria bacterium]|nr:DNA ligase D [Deltaproteobacteria bacterium]